MGQFTFGYKDTLLAGGAKRAGIGNAANKKVRLLHVWRGGSEEFPREFSKIVK
jgi:hypothetical protein